MEQLFPLMLHKNAKDRFNFEDCRFTMTRAKESTGRIVFWNMGITNSFTLEASYGGSNKGHKAYTHFNIRDYEQLGRYWCETLVDVCDPRSCSTTTINTKFWKFSSNIIWIHLRRKQKDFLNLQIIFPLSTQPWPGWVHGQILYRTWIPITWALIGLNLSTITNRVVIKYMMSKLLTYTIR